MQDNEPPKKAFVYSLWAPPIILGLILLLILIYLLVPGTLLYPPKTTGSWPNITIDQSSSAELESNLKKQIAELEKLSAEGVCTDNGFSLPDNTLRSTLFFLRMFRIFEGGNLGLLCSTRCGMGAFQNSRHSVTY